MRMEGWETSVNVFDCRWPNNTNCHLTTVQNFLMDMKDVIDIAQLSLSLFTVGLLTWMIYEAAMLMRTKRKLVKK